MIDKETEPLSATAEVDGTPPEIELKPLGVAHVRNIAEHWPKTAQASAIMPSLPKGLQEMLAEQSDEFILGFVNGVQCCHDLGIKAPLEDVRNRLIVLRESQRLNPTGPIAIDSLVTPVDRLVITAASVIEGVGYLASVALLGKKGADE
jgi:hypothetical protein